MPKLTKGLFKGQKTQQKQKNIYTSSAYRSRMRLGNPFEELAIGRFFETLLPDFVLAFAFFTSVCYAVLGKRFGQQRPAIAMSAAIGFALSVGLVDRVPPQ